MRHTIGTPYRLKLLGGLRLEGAKKLSGRVNQRRQLALLSILADHDSRSRDKLIGLLWPETTDDRARHLLSDSIYVVRKELGDDAIIGNGDEVRLNPDVVSSDLADFRSAIEAGDGESALADYGGPFLDGFHPDESEPFERWMMDERATLERAAAGAAWALVARAERAGDLHEAIRWARRALEIVPEDEEGLRKLIELHDALGDRAGAVRAYEAFAARLKEELDVEPSRETQTLIMTIRERPGSGLPGVAGPGTKAHPAEREDAAIANTRSSGSRAFAVPAMALAALLALAAIAAWLYDPGTENEQRLIDEDHPARIAVLPFETRGEGTDLWHEGMVDLISTNVDLFSGVRAVPSRTMLAQWREAGLDRNANMERALDAARRTGAHYAVTGSVLGTTDELRIRSEMFDLESGTKISDAVAIGSSDSIYGLVDRVSVELLSSILDLNTGSGNSSRLARLTSESPVAMQAFLEGERLFRAGRYQPAMEAYLRAVEADSTLALAYYRLTDIAGWMGGIDGGQYAALAAQYADRLPDREQRLVRAVGHLYEGDGKSGVELLRQAVRLYPNDAEAWYWLGEAYLHAPMYELIPRWEFVDVLERSVALDPRFFPAYEHLIHEAFFGAPDSARAADLLARQSRVGETHLHELIAFDLVFGDTDHKRAAMRKLDELTPLQLHMISDWHVAHPQFLNLKELVLRKALKQASPTFEFHHRVRLFWTLLGRGKVEEALMEARVPFLAVTRATLLYEARQRGYPVSEETFQRALNEAPPVPEDILDAPTVFERGAYAAEIGDWSNHRSAKQQLRALIPRVDSDSPGDVIRIEGLIAGLDGYATWRRGDREKALELLRSGWKKSTGGGDFNKGTVPRNRIIRWWLAELLVELDRPQEALAFYESTITLIQQDPMAFYRVAELREALGDREGALEAYENVAAAWSGDIHPDLRPLAARARSEAARLRGLQRD